MNNINKIYEVTNWDELCELTTKVLKRDDYKLCETLTLLTTQYNVDDNNQLTDISKLTFGIVNVSDTTEFKKLQTRMVNKVANMSNKDGMGPEGKGPKTGRQKGNCDGAEPKKVTK